MKILMKAMTFHETNRHFPKMSDFDEKEDVSQKMETTFMGIMFSVRKSLGLRKSIALHCDIAKNHDSHVFLRVTSPVFIKNDHLRSSLIATN